MPVMRAMTSLASRCITVRARRIMCKPTFINVDNGPACSFISSHLLLEDAPLVCVCFGMLQSFFISYAKLLECQKNSVLRYTQPFCPLVLISIRIIDNILPQHL